jgi:hypothetical protein
MGDIATFAISGNGLVCLYPSATGRAGAQVRSGLAQLPDQFKGVIIASLRQIVCYEQPCIQRQLTLAARAKAALLPG